MYFDPNMKNEIMTALFYSAITSFSDKMAYFLPFSKFQTRHVVM